MSMADTSEYKNKVVINQRGGTVEINNSTDREEVKISQFSGSNITLNNIVNSELATNNKQTKVLFDEFNTVGNSQSEYIGKDRVLRVGENNYEIKGVRGNADIASEAFVEWKEAYRPVAEVNAQFNILRGGIGYPYSTSAVSTPLSGLRSTNPDFRNRVYAVENSFSGFTGIPYVKSNTNQVVAYTTVPDKNRTIPATLKSPNANDILKGFGPSTGTGAPGVIRFGVNASAATEQGTWNTNIKKQNIAATILEKQKELLPIEQKMGNGGDDIESINRHKVLNVGATFNEYPSVRIDLEGRSQPTEVGVCDTGIYKHHDYIPHVEEVDNSSNFPCGNYTIAVGNKLNILVGSGGVQMKTSGPVNIGGSIVKISGTKTHIMGAAGVVISSDTNIDMYAQQMQLRSQRQILVDSSLGIQNNIIIGGGAFVGGELYVNHITAPLEVQETMLTTAYGHLVQGKPIGRVTTDTGTYTVYALATADTVKLYDHSHHFNNIPIRLMQSNKDVRLIAQSEAINRPQIQVKPIHQVHERKLANVVNVV